MNSTNFTWGDDLIDSRDIINRYDELQEEYDTLVDSLEEAKNDFEEYLELGDKHLTEKDTDFEKLCEQFREVIETAQEALNEFNSSFDKDELDTLREIVEQGENSSDWGNETLIHDDYFTDYIKDLINDCYEMPKEFESGNWPYNHMTMHYDDAAEEAKVDYTTIEADGQTYYIR